MARNEFMKIKYGFRLHESGAITDKILLDETSSPQLWGFHIAFSSEYMNLASVFKVAKNLCEHLIN